MDSFLRMVELIHLTQSNDLLDINLQNSFRTVTLFISVNERKPSPPSSLGQHTSSQDNFALCGLRSLPDYKNAEQSLSISRTHAFGSRNADNQKLEMLQSTELRSSSLPA